MMISELDSGTAVHGDGNSNNGQLLRDIEAISKALYLHKPPQTALVSSTSRRRSNSVDRPHFSEPKLNLNPVVHDKSVLYKDKKSSSVWNWKKPLKVLAHIGRQKFNICFFLHVHSVEGLPPSFNDFSLRVHWKRKDEILQTGPSKVLGGIAEFNETLMHKSAVYGSRSGSNHAAKYDEKLFLIYTAVVGAPGVDMGKQWVDLTRLLPLNLEELDREKSFGKWTTTFKLSGKAGGATLNISFGYSVIGDGLIEPRSHMNVTELVNLAYYGSPDMETRAGLDLTGNNAMLRRVGSVPSDLNRRSSLGSQTADMKICDDVSSNLGFELSKSINFLYQKLNEVKLQSSEGLETPYENADPLKNKLDSEFHSETSGSGNENDSIDFTVIDKGIEIVDCQQTELDHRVIQTEDSSAIETIDVDEIIIDEDVTFDEKKTLNSEENTSDTYMDKILVDDYEHEENTVDKGKAIVDEMETAFHRFLASEYTAFEMPWDMSEFFQQESFTETKSDCKSDKLRNRSHSFDDVTESIERDFLKLLDIEHSPFGPSSESDLESPRERLLRDFEKDFLDSGELFTDYDAREHGEFHFTAPNRSGCEELSDDFHLSLAIQVQEEQQQPTSLLNRRKAEVLEDLETETLLREWGLNEQAFHSSPRYCSDGFGSPVEILPSNPVELPPLGDGFGSSVLTKHGGCLRSMTSSLFKDSKMIGHLIMQVSHPVVLPVELGSDIMEILQHLALVGIDQLALKLSELMPLEDITGKTLQQIAHDATTETIVLNRQGLFDHESLFGPNTIAGTKKAGEYSSSWFFSNMKSSTFDTEMDLGYVSPEYLSSLMLNKIEGISIEGLRIQSGLSEDKAPSSISPENVGNISSLEGKSAYLHELLSLEGDTVMQLYDHRDGGKYVTKLLGLSLPLEEWLRCDAGFIGNEDHLSSHSIAVLAAHHAKCINSVDGTVIRDVGLDYSTCTKEGLLGNNITIAVRVLHRDPLRNYEPVGAPMLALVQVERAHFCPQPMLYRTVVGCNQQDGNVEEEMNNEGRKDEEMKEESSVWFKITEVNLSGLSTEPGQIPRWCTKTQQQSGTRWLVANGMSKSCKNPFPRSNAIVVSYPQMIKMLKNRDSLWSLSSRMNDAETKWNELAGFTSHTRNPDVIFP